MTPQQELEQTLDAFFAEGADEIADRVIDSALDEVRRTKQRPALYGPWRDLPMSSMSKIAAVAAALVVAVLGGALLLGGFGRGGIGGATASSPTASARAGSVPPSLAASPSGACATEAFKGNALARATCVYSSQLFRPKALLPGNPDWTLVEENARYFQLNSALPGGEPNHEGLALATIDRLSAKPCQPSNPPTDQSTVRFSPGPGLGPGQFFDWLKRTTPLTFAAPTPIAIGGRNGLETTITFQAGSLSRCADAIFYTWTGDPPTGGGAQGVYVGLTWRLIALDVGSTTVTIEAWAPPERWGAFAPEADKMITSLRFE